MCECVKFPTVSPVLLLTKSDCRGDERWFINSTPVLRSDVVSQAEKASFVLLNPIGVSQEAFLVEGCLDSKFPASRHCTATALLHIQVVHLIFSAEVAAYRSLVKFSYFELMHEFYNLKGVTISFCKPR